MTERRRHELKFQQMTQGEASRGGGRRRERRQDEKEEGAWRAPRQGGAVAQAAGQHPHRQARSLKPF